MTFRKFRSACFVFGSLVGAFACSSENGTTGNTAGSAGVASGGSAGVGVAGSSAVAGSAGTASSTAGAGQGGSLNNTAGSAGSSSGGGSVNGGAGAGQAGTAGAGQAGTGQGGSSGSGGSGGSGTGGSGGSGTGVSAGCTADPHPLCIDFESGIDKAVWTGGSDAAVSTADKAHGTHSYHAYAGGAGVLTTTKLNGITNMLWGRFYLRMTPGMTKPPGPAPVGTPGAPGGHGNIAAAFQGGDWYELGWQFNGLMGVWHYGGGENPLRSHPTIMDQWYCVELQFDGTKTEMQHWFVDGKEVEYYMGEPNNTKPHLITQFDKVTIGFTSYAGLGIAKDPYGNNNDPVMTDMWLDDIAFDTKRIGCIAP